MTRTALDMIDPPTAAAIVFLTACMFFGVGIHIGIPIGKWAWRRYERRSWRRVR